MRFAVHCWSLDADRLRIYGAARRRRSRAARRHVHHDRAPAVPDRGSLVRAGEPGLRIPVAPTSRPVGDHVRSTTLVLLLDDIPDGVALELTPFVSVDVTQPGSTNASLTTTNLIVQVRASAQF